MSQYAQDFLDKSPRFFTVVTGDDGHVYGVQTSQVAVTTSSAQLLAENARRVSWTLCNDSAGKVYISWAPGVLTTTGFPIFASGGVLETSQIDDKNIARMAIYAIGAAASTIAIIEVVRLD